MSNPGFLLGRVASSRPAAPERFYALNLTEHRAVVEMWVRVAGGFRCSPARDALPIATSFVRAARNEGVGVAVSDHH